VLVRIDEENLTLGALGQRCDRVAGGSKTHSTLKGGEEGRGRVIEVAHVEIERERTLLAGKMTKFLQEGGLADTTGARDVQEVESGRVRPEHGLKECPLAVPANETTVPRRTKLFPKAHSQLPS
jgi:hypothetical protein